MITRIINDLCSGRSTFHLELESDNDEVETDNKHDAGIMEDLRSVEKKIDNVEQQLETMKY